MTQVSSDVVTTDDWLCVYNRDQVSRQQASDLVSDGGAALLAGARCLNASDSRATYQAQIGERCCYVKEFRAPPGRRSPWQRWPGAAVSLARYRGSERLRREGFPIAEPILAIVPKTTGRQILAEEFRAESVPLSGCLVAGDGPSRRECMGQVADLLSDLHGKRVYAPELSADDILVVEQNGTRSLCLTELGILGRLWLSKRRRYPQTVANACAAFYDVLSPEERRFFFAACFDFALKKNIYSRPSQQTRFIRAVAAARDRRARHPG